MMSWANASMSWTRGSRRRGCLVSRVVLTVTTSRRRKNPHARPAIAAPMTGAQRRRQNVTPSTPDVLVETWRPKARISMAMLILPSSPPITPELTPVRSIAMTTIAVCCRRCEGGIGLSEAAPEPFLGAEEAVKREPSTGSGCPSASVRPVIGIFRSSWASSRGAWFPSAMSEPPLGRERFANAHLHGARLQQVKPAALGSSAFDLAGGFHGRNLRLNRP